MNNENTKEYCLSLLIRKAEELERLGLSRYPQRSDFSDTEVCAIKACFGPWPRALEAANIKPLRDDDRVVSNREKRIRAKRNRTASKISANSTENKK